MPCLRCGTIPTIRAHLIPQAFAKEVRDGDQDHAFVRPNGKFRPTKNGLFDHDLLCAPCDGQLGSLENYAFQSLQRLRSATTASFNRTIEVDGLDTDKLLRFLAGLVWKYASTRRDLGRVDIGPYRTILEDVAFSNAPIPPSVDAFIMRAYTGDEEVYNYRAPLPQRVEGKNFVRCWLGGCLFFLKLDKRPNPLNPPERHWLRNRASFLFYTPPLGWIEEGRMTVGLRQDNPALDAFLRKAAIRKTQ